MKEFYPNIDPNFLMLRDLDAQLLIEQVMGGDPTSFMVAASVVLDAGIDIANFDFQVEDDPPRAVRRVRVPVLYFPNLQKLHGQKRRKNKCVIFFLFFLLM